MKVTWKLRMAFGSVTSAPPSLPASAGSRASRVMLLALAAANDRLTSMPTVSSVVGIGDGGRVGRWVSVGWVVGENVGYLVFVGLCVGRLEGKGVGWKTGCLVGAGIGSFVGAGIGRFVGEYVVAMAVVV